MLYAFVFNYFAENREDYFNICIPLYAASFTGDWEAAKNILDRHPERVRCAITDNCQTALHIAVAARETRLTGRYVENLVKLMTDDDVELQDMDGYTAFCKAALAGNVKICEYLFEKHHKLLDIPSRDGRMPLNLAAVLGRYEVVKYLYDKSNKMSSNHWKPQDQKSTLEICVDRNFFDIALQIVNDRPELADNATLLRIMARKTRALNGVKGNLATRIIKSICRFIQMKAQPDAEEDTDALKLLRVILRHTIRGKEKKTVDDIFRGHDYKIASSGQGDETPEHSFKMLFVASELGNTRFVVEILRLCPDLIWMVNDDNLSIFHIAVMCRHPDIYNLLYEIGLMRDCIFPLKDKDGNNMLHLAGMSSVKMRPKMSGATLLLQRELLWFQEVEKIMPRSYRLSLNNEGKTPYQLFFEANQDLVSNGLDCMKDCMVVATLLITLQFAVAFTVPGGYNQEHGAPIFIHKLTFLVFVIADCISLFFSAMSLIAFLSILTSHDDQRQFINLLPPKLTIGLTAIFISGAAMMATFSASFFVLYHKGLKWIPIFIAVAAPVSGYFAVSQFPVLLEMLRSRYDSHYLFKPKKPMLYSTNPRF
ncbi:ankyrin repeat-containing domain, PGG domain protein [Artemisia annua]|uniref:Ankyrin repeat-containing domain, PGG domain protein n=1 Tax=Artemisia annua TaxID=35608 RepID=A0A2U1L4W2_ARTAN|nr:ankyrin repeat-containing domain, PGG domain protein [Artemisia annua]